MRRRTGWSIGLGAGLVLGLLVLLLREPGPPSSDSIGREVDGGAGVVPTAGGDAATLVGRGEGDAAGGLPPPVDLERVDRRLDLHGVVVRADGTPVAGARLEVVTYPWRSMGLPGTDLYDLAVPGPSTLSASDGTFALRLRSSCPPPLADGAAIAGARTR